MSHNMIHEKNIVIDHYLEDHPEMSDCTDSEVERLRLKQKPTFMPQRSLDRSSRSTAPGDDTSCTSVTPDFSKTFAFRKESEDHFQFRGSLKIDESSEDDMENNIARSVCEDGDDEEVVASALAWLRGEHGPAPSPTPSPSNGCVRTPPGSSPESLVDDFSDIFSESLDGELSCTPLPFTGYDSESFFSESSRSSEGGYDADSDLVNDESVSPGNVCRRLLLDTCRSDRRRMNDLAGVYQQQSATRQGCVRDQVLCELFLHGDGRFHHMRTHSRDSNYDLAISTPMLIAASNSLSDTDESSGKTEEPISWWRAAALPTPQKKATSANKKVVKRRNTICAKSDSSVKPSNTRDTWWAVLTDGIWVLDDDTIILHVERDKFCSGPDGENLARPDFAGELESSSPELTLGKDGVVASRAVCSLELKDGNILSAKGAFPGQFCRWYSKRDGASF